MPTPIISFPERRRLRRALTFITSILSSGDTDAVTGLGPQVPELQHVVGLNVDVGVTRAQPPGLRRNMLSHARDRKTALTLFRIRDPAPGICESLADVAYVDELGSGVALLNDLSWWCSPTGSIWYLVPRPGEVILRVARDEGLIPTLRPPWSYGNRHNEREGFALADHLLSAFVWEG